MRQRCHFVEQPALFRHIRCAKERSRKYQFPMQRHGFGFERHGIEHCRVINQAKAALRCYQFDDIGPVGQSA